MSPNAEGFRKALSAVFESCSLAGKDIVEIRAGDLHREVGDYPGPNHRLSVCCYVMTKEIRDGDEILQTTPSGIGANLIVRYRIPRPVIKSAKPAVSDTSVINHFNATLNIKTDKGERAAFKMDVANNINKYMEKRTFDKRYASFDYCFNYFQEFYERDNIQGIAIPKNIQQSCLHLGFFLASWGMFRGKSFLLQKSAKHFEGLIIEISKLDKKYWAIDADNYDDKSVRSLLKVRDVIFSKLGGVGEKATITLVTKIMLGVFGSVPAFDENFCKAFRITKNLNEKALKTIATYYQNNTVEFGKFYKSIRTLDFSTGKETSRLYTKAKLVDMVGFVEGDKITRANRQHKKPSPSVHS